MQIWAGPSLLVRNKAGDRIRTDDNNVGNVVLYQLSYTRISESIIYPSVCLEAKAKIGEK